MQKTKKNKAKSGSRPAKSSIPLALNSMMSAGYNRMVNGKNGDSIVVRNREYVTPALCNGDNFTVTSIPINPGLGGSFPWLSHIAHNYESYRFRRLTVEYRPVVPATQKGSVAVCIDYDAADPAPISKQGFMSNQNAITGPVWAPIDMHSEKSNLMKMASSRYTRAGGLSANLDIKTYDLGVAHIGVNDTTGLATSVGEIYFDYEVELSTPQYNIIDEAADSSAKITGTADVSKTNLFGSKQTILGNLPISVKSTGDGLFFQEAGDYLLNYAMDGVNITNAPTLASNDAQATLTPISKVINGALTGIMGVLAVRIMRPNTVFYPDMTGSSTSVSAATWRIAKYLSTMV